MLLLLLLLRLTKGTEGATRSIGRLLALDFDQAPKRAGSSRCLPEHATRVHRGFCCSDLYLWQSGGGGGWVVII